MNQLNAVITHLPAEEVERDMRSLREVAPGSRFIACYTGPAAEFERLEDAVLVEDGSLGGAAQSYQAYHSVLAALAEHPFEALYLFEYDHLILDPQFEQALVELAERTGGDFMGKNCVRRNGTNWSHYTRFRRDPKLLAHLRTISTRDDPTVIFGTLGDGMWFTRAAVESYLSLQSHPPCYGELYVPTILHHLGHRLIDIDAAGDLYRDVRWTPEFSGAEIEALRRSGAVFAHPVKDGETRRTTAAAASTSR